jgi:lipopolysaccharide/colanic/teichoic acid biosynthesis glycosyltransferase
MADKVHHHYSSFGKFFFDFVMGWLVLLACFPVFIFISLAILYSASWPVFFVQKRMGRGNKPFKMYKFRTMYRGAHNDQKKLLAKNQAPGPMFKIFDDPRFVGVGSWLSKIGLDELPQLVNIVRGEMSFVGPRPLPVKEALALKENWNFRHLVKPGIFSEWTLSDDRHKSLSDWINLDKKTLANGGIIYDLKLIIKTVGKILRIKFINR